MLSNVLLLLFTLSSVRLFRFNLFDIDDDDSELAEVFDGVRNIIKEHGNGDANNNTENQGKKIEKFIQKQSETEINNKTVTKTTEFYKFPNHTFKMVERDGRYLNKREETAIGCVEDVDCNSTFYCDKFTYSCRSCHEEKLHCSRTEECCNGYECDLASQQCKRRKGREGDSCEELEECNEDYCCALNNNGDGECQPYIRAGQDCGKDPFDHFPSSHNNYLQEALSGLPSKCPCTPGLKCIKQNSFFFFNNEICARKEERKGLIKLKIRPSVTFHQAPNHHPKSISDVYTSNNFKEHERQHPKHSKELHHRPSFMSLMDDDDNDVDDGLDDDDDDDDGGLDNIFESVLKGVIEALKYRE